MKNNSCQPIVNSYINERLSTTDSLKRIRSAKIELVPSHVREFLDMRQLPAMLNAAQTAAYLDCGSEHNIPVLVREGLLEPLGDPAPNAIKYFATVEVLELAADVEKLKRIRSTIYK